MQLWRLPICLQGVSWSWKASSFNMSQIKWNRFFFSCSELTSQQQREIGAGKAIAISHKHRSLSDSEQGQERRPPHAGKVSLKGEQHLAKMIVVQTSGQRVPPRSYQSFVSINKDLCTVWQWTLRLNLFWRQGWTQNHEDI